MAENELLHNRQGLGLVHGPRGFVCIDNIGLIGKDREEVNLLMEKICRELCSQGLLTHELCLPSRCCDILGVDELDGGRLRTSRSIGYIREIATGTAMGPPWATTWVT